MSYNFRKYGCLGGSFVGVLLVVWLVLSILFLKHVDTGYTGVLIDYGISGSRPVATNIASNTWFWMNGFAGQVFVEYPSSQQTLAMVANGQEGEFPGNDSVKCQDISGIEVSRDITVNWQVVDAAKLYLQRRIPNLSGSINNDVVSLVVRQAVKSATQTACSQFAWDQMSAKTTQIGSLIESILNPELAANGIDVTAVYPGEVHYNATQQNALNANAIAQQQALQAQYLQQKASYEAQAAITAAEGQAKAIAILNTALANNPNYLKYLMIQKWDGILPKYEGSGTPLFPIQ